VQAIAMLGVMRGLARIVEEEIELGTAVFPTVALLEIPARLAEVDSVEALHAVVVPGARPVWAADRAAHPGAEDPEAGGEDVVAESMQWT